MERSTKALVAKMSASFPDPGEAEMWFHKLKEVKDNDIFRVLKELLNGGDAHSIRVISSFSLLVFFFFFCFSLYFQLTLLTD